MLFAGVADARNLFATLIAIAKYDRHMEQPLKNVQITVNDVQAPTLARVLIPFSLSKQLAQSLDSTEEERYIILKTIFFFFYRHLMPPLTADNLQISISKLFEDLESGKQMFSMIGVRSVERAAILNSLVSWQEITFDLIEMKLVVEHLAGGMSSMPAPDIPRGCKEEQISWSKTAALFLPTFHRERLTGLEKGL